MTTSQVLPLAARGNPDQSLPALGAGQSKLGALGAAAEGAEVQSEALGLAADIDYDVEDGVLPILVAGPLDLRCTSHLLAIGRAVDDSITACRLSLTGVTHVFDSGIAALMLLTKALTRRGVGIHIEGPESVLLIPPIG